MIDKPNDDVPQHDAVFSSGLPNVAIHPTLVGREEHFANGGRCGLSRSALPKGGTIEILHYVSGISGAWESVADQWMIIWSCVDRIRAGGMRLWHPRVAECGTGTAHESRLDFLDHPEIWVVEQVDVQDEFRRRKVATSMYAHVREFGYTLAPSDILLGDGLALWGSMHPGLIDSIMEGTAIQAEIPPFDDALLQKLLTTFGENKDPNAKTAQISPLTLRHDASPPAVLLALHG